MNRTQIGELYNTSQQAVSNKINRYLKRQGKLESDKLLPWKVTAAHSHNTFFYRAAESYAKWRKGVGINKSAREEAEQLEKVARELDAVLIYTPELGFHWRDRRPDDTEAIAAE